MSEIRTGAVFEGPSPLRSYAGSENNACTCIIENTAKAPSVSVVIPCFNNAAFLRESADSVLGQSLEKLELLLIDDGSTDETLSVMKDLAGKDGRVSVFTQKNSGPGAARNAGIAAARGEYVYFLDGDDCLSDPQGLEKLYAAASKDRLDIICFSSVTFFEDKETEQAFSRILRAHPAAGITGILPGRRFLVAQYDSGCHFPTVWLYMFHRAFLIENDIRFTEKVLYEDNLFILKSLLAAERVAEAGLCPHKRRIRQGSIMTGKKDIDHFWSFRCLYEQALPLAETPGLAPDERKTLCELILSYYRSALDIYTNDLGPAEKEWLTEALPANWYAPLSTADLGLRAMREREELLNSVTYRTGLFLTRFPALIKQLFSGSRRK